MKKLIASINNPKSDTIHSMCLIATMLCAVQFITNVANLSTLIYNCFTVSDVQTVSYEAVLSNQLAGRPSFWAILVRLVLSGAAACLCVLSFRGMSRPVQRGSLIAAGVCLLALSALILLSVPSVLYTGTPTVIAAVIAAAAAAAAGVLIMLDRSPNIFPAALLTVFFFIVLALKNILPLTMLDAAAALLGSTAVLMASRDPKMA